MPAFIEIDALSKSYTQDQRTIYALQQVSLQIEKGDIYGIIGLSGAGKSTLIRCLSSLVPPTAGRILFSGEDLAAMGKGQLRAFRHKIGMIFQHFNLLSSRTVAENVEYPLEIAKIPQQERAARIETLLKLVGLSEKKDAYPSQLSGGEKQRVGIARALANHPDVLLCDEATSALDPKTTREILSLLKTIHQKLGITIVLITHEMDVIKSICNKVAVIEKGRIVEKGTVANLFADPQHPTTRHFLQIGAHDIPDEFFKEVSERRKLLRLRFKGKAAAEPIISELVRKFDVDANILMGWIDRLQTLTIGTLVIELTGKAENVHSALQYLTQQSVHYEVIENGL